jgi:transposase
MQEQQHEREVLGGVDTHADQHVAAVVSQIGKLLGTSSFPATPAGYAALLEWMQSFGVIVAVGVEGTGSYGSGLAGVLNSLCEGSELS